MSRDTRFLGRFAPAWKYALIGGLLSIPLSLGDYWLSGMGTDFSANMVFVAAVVAGYLAQRGGASATTAGLGAGAIGSLPIYAIFFPGAVRSVSAWPSPIGGVLVLLLLAASVVCFNALAGGLGGLLGGWLAKKFDGPQRPAVGS